MTEADTRTGTVIGERYRVLGVIGAGAMGTVYRVEHLGIQKEMALKLLHRELGQMHGIAERFQREAKLAAQLDHPSIVQVSDFGASNDDLFMVMELISGAPLTRWVQEQPLSCPDALALIDEVLLALGYAHAAGVVHRDVKPDNILVLGKDPWRIKLLDFGLAKMVEAPVDEAPLTRAGMVFGTPRYMAPEQAAGEAVDARGDLYAVGVILYELLARRPLFTGETITEVMRKHITKPPPPLGLSPLAEVDVAALEAVVAKSLGKEPRDRFATAEAFRQALLGVRRDPDLTLPRLPTPRPAFSAPNDVGLISELGRVRWQSQLLTWLRGLLGPKEGWLRRATPVAAVVVAGAIVLGVLAGTLVGRELSLVAQAQVLWDSGDRAGAARLVDQALRERADNPEALLLRGHLTAQERGEVAALEDYRRALDLSPDLAADPRLQTALLNRVKAKPAYQEELLSWALAKKDPAVGPLLALLAQEAPLPRSRRDAYEALEKLEATAALSDPVGYLKEQLATNSTDVCELRLWYLERLVRFEDPRVQTILATERDRRVTVFRLRQNGCMKELFDRYLK